jgi:hypothetical protein
VTQKRAAPILPLPHANFPVRNKRGRQRAIVNSMRGTELLINMNREPFFPMAIGRSMPNLEVIMPLTVVLAVGSDSSLPAGQGSVWQSSRYIVTFKGSAGKATGRLRSGDSDRILRGHSITASSGERLTSLIRSTGSRIPVVDVPDSSGDCTAWPKQL